jgi:hypothetical protein
MALQRINVGYGGLRIDGNLQVVTNTANVYLGNITYPLGSIFASNVNTSGNITVGGNITSTSTVFTRVAAGTTAQRPAGGLTGMIRYNSTVNSYEGYGSAWTILGGVKSYSGNAFIQAETSSAAGDDVLRFYSGSTGSSVQVMWASGANVSILPTTISTSSSTGALQVAGGVGIAGNVYIGGSAGTAMVATGNVLPSANVTYNLGSPTLRWKDLYLSGTTIDLGGTTISAPTGGALSVATGNIVAGSSAVSTSTTTGALVVLGGAGVVGAIYNGGVLVSGGNIVAASGTSSSSITTGALVVVGGAGISGAVNVGGTITPASNVAQNLGSSTAYWGTTFTGQLTANTAVINAGTANAIVATGKVYVAGDVIPLAANVSYNLGSTSSWWNTFYGVSTQAKYADVAENYLADRPYPAGTVLEFGGEAEVTIGTQSTTRIAGIVSSNPAHLMNGGLQGPNVVAVALLGRVPCQVIGPVAKGDLMVSAGFGYAKTNNNPQPGQVIGKALEEVTGQNKAIIEVVVGRV